MLKRGEGIAHRETVQTADAQERKPLALPAPSSIKLEHTAHNPNALLVGCIYEVVPLYEYNNSGVFVARPSVTITCLGDCLSKGDTLNLIRELADRQGTSITNVDMAYTKFIGPTYVAREVCGSA